MSSDSQSVRLERKDYGMIVAWTLLFLIAYAALMTAHVFLDPSIKWVLPWKLAGISVLLVFAAQRGHYPLVLGLTGTAYLLQDYPLYGLYFFTVTSILYALLHYGGKWSRGLFWSGLILLVVILPKCSPLLPTALAAAGKGAWWMDMASTGLFLRYTYYAYEWRHNLWERPDYFKHLGYIAFIPQILANLNISPSQQWNHAGNYPVVFRQGLQLLGLAFAKILSFQLLNLVGPTDTGTTTLSAWIYVLLNYLKWFLWFSGHFDLAVVFCRFLGADLPANFRLPLLATSPIEHWRRWNIFDRKFLMHIVYFPLGGSRNQTTRNVIVVFLASVLILQTGWWGSRNPALDPVPLLHGLVYALAQAGLVLANRAWREHKHLDSHHVSRGWAAAIGWAGTFSVMAWLHVLILGHPSHTFPGDTLLSTSERFQLMLRGLGF